MKNGIFVELEFRIKVKSETLDGVKEQPSTLSDEVR
jgi:hypothetical protein